jgi:3-deoxy-D-manno-octulosonic-acid transferase
MRERRRGIYLLYQMVLAVGSLLLMPWVLSRLLFQPGFRHGFLQRLGFLKPLPKADKRILLHGVSVGEVKALRPLIQLLQQELPDYELVVSATTSSGLGTAKQAFPDLRVVHFPLDFNGSTRRFLKRVAPTAVILAELEIWPNFLRQCNRREIAVAIVNGRITERSMGGYQRVQKLLPQFDRIHLYCVQNQRYADRFLALDVPKQSVVVTGNLKYDSLPKGLEQAQQPWQSYLAGRPAMVLASTHEPEEVQLMTAVAAPEVDLDCICIVVPRHPHRAGKLLGDLKKALPNRPVILRSRWQQTEPLPDRAVLLVDTFGELESIYSAVDLALVGGSLIPHGGQNVLEPAAFALPVLIGPHYDNFVEEVQLLTQAEALRSAKDLSVLLECARNWLTNPSQAQKAGLAGRAALDSRRGAAQTTFDALIRAGIF